MTRKGALFFLLVCLLAGAGAVLGLLIGHALIQSAIHPIAFIGGIAGIYTAARIAMGRRILGPKRFWPGVIGGVLGLVLAALVVTNPSSTLPIRIATILLVGLGALFGAGSRHGKDISD